MSVVSVVGADPRSARRIEALLAASALELRARHVAVDVPSQGLQTLTVMFTYDGFDGLVESVSRFLGERVHPKARCTPGELIELLETYLRATAPAPVVEGPAGPRP